MAPLLLAQGLKEKGQQVSIWADPHSFLGKKARERGFQVQPFRFRGYLHPAGIGQIRANLRQHRPDLIHLHHTRDLWAVVPALKLEKWMGPLFLTKHVASGVLKKGFFHRWLYQRVDRLLTCSDFIRENVIATCPVAPSKVKTSYMPADLREFRFKPVIRKKNRKAWGWEKNEVIGMVSRISPGKGHELFLQMAAKLVALRPRMRFRLAGSPTADQKWYYDEMLALREKLGLRKIVVYDGYVPDVAGFLSSLDLAVHMAAEESFGMAVVEAMACGRPTVVRRGGGVAEILETKPGQAGGGLVVNGDDPEVWAQTLAGILESKALMAKFHRETRKIALRFSLEPWINRHLQWYRELLEGKSKGL